MMKKKIGLYLGIESSDGGSFQYALAMLNAVSALPKEKYAVVLAYSTKEWEGHLKKTDLEKRYVPLSFVGKLIPALWQRSGLPISLWRKLSPFIHPFTRKMVRVGCDLWVFPAQDSWTYRLPVPAVGVVHDLMHRYESKFPEVGGRGVRRRRERHFKNICQWSKVVIVDSAVGKNHVIESYGMEEGRIHPIPLVPPSYIYARPRPENLEKCHKLPGKFIFYPAQFWEHKNHKRLLMAVNMLKSELTDLHVVFSGTKKNAYRSVRALVNELGLGDRVTFLGYVPNEDMPELYKRARALVMPTFFGPTNIPPLEAFVAGCPVAISGIYGMPEQMGDAALLFDPESVEEISDVVKKLWTDDQLCQTLVQRGKRRIKEISQANFNSQLHHVVDLLTKN